jgi:hypothetical protein
VIVLINAEENLTRLREIKAKMLEYVDFLTTVEEQEMRKREAIPPEMQTKDEDVQDEEKVTEEEELDEEELAEDEEA